MKKIFTLIFATLLVSIPNLKAQTGSWQLWASGLPGGAYPKLSIAPNHDIFYGLVSTSTLGIVYKGNTLAPLGTMTAMPVLPMPSSLVNNIMAIECNVNSEPIVGIFRNNSAQPFMFKYDNPTNSWTTVTVDVPPTLGAYAMAKSPDGTLWMGAKWHYVYKSTDNGLTYNHIDETALVQAAYPCYYPTWGGNPGDGAIYSINVDGNGRVYAGTEGAGVIYSDDAGATWNPTDFYACQTSNNTLRDSFSVMLPISHTGNLGGIGFTANNNLIWNGTDMWQLNWTQNLGFADMTAHTLSQVNGFPNYFIGSGLQITKIVTTTNGRIFLHSGSNSSVSGTVGIYTSTDGINWTPFNTGITGINDGQSQGSLAVDGNKVFMATRDGNIFVYDASLPLAVPETTIAAEFSAFPNPASSMLTIHSDFSMIGSTYTISDAVGRIMKSDKITSENMEVSIADFSKGIYFLQVADKTGKAIKIVKE